jgi:hypothetical protein
MPTRHLLLLALIFPPLPLLLMRRYIHSIISLLLFAIAISQWVLWDAAHSLLLITIAWGHVLLLTMLKGWFRSTALINHQLRVM